MRKGGEKGWWVKSTGMVRCLR